MAIKYRDLVQFDPIQTVVQLHEADDKNEAAALVRTYVISDRMADLVTRLVIPQLQMSSTSDNKGVFVVGNYGTGKSHLMSVLSAVAEHADLTACLENQRVLRAFEGIAGRFNVVRTEIGSTTMPLRDILFGELELALKRWGIDYRFPAMHQAPNNKHLLEEMMAAFQQRFPGQGLLLVVDELLEYLRSRRDQELVLDLTYLREIGEVCKTSDFRFIAGIQESLFDSPRFQHVADSVRRVKDRFEQMRIAREDVAHVVAERLLRKDEDQKRRIRQHLQKFTPLYGAMAERLDEFVRLFPVHPTYLEVFERVHVVEKREILRTLSSEMQARLELDLPTEQPGLIAYDSYWVQLRGNPAFRAVPDIREVIDKAQVLEDRVKHAMPRRQYMPAAERIIHALSVHRLSTGDIYAPIGATAEELRDGLCLYLPIPEPDADFLKTTVEAALREIMRTVSGQFLSFNSENGQYYLDLKKDIDFDAQIEQRAESIGDDERNRYYFEALAQVMEFLEAPYVAGYRIWQHEVEWRERRVKRPGYLFFGAPNQRSTAQPPREFYLYVLPPYNPPAFVDEQKPDEVFFRLMHRDEQFETALRLYAGAREMAVSTSVNNRGQYERKAADHLQTLQQWLRENLPKAMEVTYRGTTGPFTEWLKGGAAPRSMASVRDLVNVVASACLASHFAAILPDYPGFSVLITQANRAQAAQEALKWLAGGIKTQQGTAVLDALGVLEGGQVRPRKSTYAAYWLGKLLEKPDGHVLNRSELFGGPAGAEVDTRFRLEPEWVAVVLLALAYGGELSLALPGMRIDASNLDEALKIGIAQTANWKFIERPKGLPLAALAELCQFLEVPADLLAAPEQHALAVDQIRKQVASEVDRVVMALRKVTDGLALWNMPLLGGPDRSDLVKRLGEYKAFLESLQAYNNPGKLRNFSYSVQDIQGYAAGRVLRLEVEMLAEVVASIQPLAAYLVTAAAVLPAGHEWPAKVWAMRDAQLASLQDPAQRRQPHLRAALSGALENLQSEYIELYLALHRQARLDATGDEIKKHLLSDPRQKQLKLLAGIDIMPVAKLQEFQSELAAIRPCFMLEASQLKAYPICPHCGYRPVEEPSPITAEDRLAALCGRLTDLFSAWTQVLIDNLSAEQTKDNIPLLSPDRQGQIQAFVDSAKVPADLGYEFVDTMREALGGLQRVDVLPEDILMALTQGGMPCTLHELNARFQAFMSERTAGKDTKKVRIVIEW